MQCARVASISRSRLIIYSYQPRLPKMKFRRMLAPRFSGRRVCVCKSPCRPPPALPRLAATCSNSTKAKPRGWLVSRAGGHTARGRHRRLLHTSAVHIASKYHDKHDARVCAHARLRRFKVRLTFPVRRPPRTATGTRAATEHNARVRYAYLQCTRLRTLPLLRGLRRRG